MNAESGLCGSWLTVCSRRRWSRGGRRPAQSGPSGKSWEGPWELGHRRNGARLTCALTCRVQQGQGPGHRRQGDASGCSPLPRRRPWGAGPARTSRERGPWSGSSSRRAPPLTFAPPAPPRPSLSPRPAPPFRPAPLTFAPPLSTSLLSPPPRPSTFRPALPALLSPRPALTFAPPPHPALAPPRLAPPLRPAPPSPRLPPARDPRPGHGQTLEVGR